MAVRDDVEKKLREIFGIDKVTFSEPGSFEQDTLFVEVEDCKVRPSKGFAYGQLTGSLVLFTQAEKAPLGFFAKRINNSGTKAKDFFFYEVDTEILNSPARVQNISERRCRFRYFYKEQYDPARGQLAGLELEQVVFIETGDGRVQGTGEGPVIGVNP